jgi:hypothetical protein
MHDQVPDYLDHAGGMAKAMAVDVVGKDEVLWQCGRYHPACLHAPAFPVGCGVLRRQLGQHGRKNN